MKTFTDWLNSIKGFSSLKFILFVFVIIIGETVFMAVLHWLEIESIWSEAILDGVFVGVWAAVFCYVLYVIPLNQTLKLNTELRSEVEDVNFNLQQKVDDQSAHLQSKNEILSRNLQVQAAQKNILSLAMATISLEEFLQQALSQILKIPWLSLDGQGLIFLVDNSGHNLILKAQSGIHPEILSACQVVPLGKCLCGKTAMTHQATFCKSTAPSHEISFLEMTTHGHWCFPIMDGNINLGVLNLYVPVGRKPNNYEESFLKSATDALALAIRRRMDERKLHLMFQAVEQSPLMVAITDPAGIIEVTNTSFLTNSGYGKNEVLGKPFSFLDAEESQNQGDQKPWEAVLQGQAWNGVVQDRMKNNSLFWSRTMVSPIKDSNGSISNFLVFKEDITQEIITAEKRKELEENAFRLQRFQVVGTLASSIAHDFRNILQAVAGFSELALSDTSLEDSQKNVSEILLATTRGMDLINRFRNVGRPGPVEKSRFSLEAQIQEVGTMLNAVVPLGIKLVVTCEVPTGEIFADFLSIQRVVLNMCMNGIHAMKLKGGCLSLNLKKVYLAEPIPNSILPSKPGSYISLQVADTGTGIPQELRDKIFEPYFSTKSPKEGTGLGLSAVLDALKTCNGFLTLFSKVGEGTKFTLYFPAID